MSKLPAVNSVWGGDDLATTVSQQYESGKAFAYEFDIARCANVEEVFNQFAEEGWSGDSSALGIEGFKQAVALLASTPQDLSQPFTVEWLCEIGGELASPQENESVIGFWSRHGSDWVLRYSTIDGWSLCGMKTTYFAPPITTRADVLKWLDVLGIQTTAKGGDK